MRWRFTHNRDMVPSVPIQLMGFRHVAQEVRASLLQEGRRTVHAVVGPVYGIEAFWTLSERPLPMMSRHQHQHAQKLESRRDRCVP